ncbi:MAG: (Fe-S)-binding protein, partial [Nitrospirota bacterium]
GLTVSRLSVTLNGLSGVNPATLGIQLVSPGGTTANLLRPGDVAGTGPFNFAQITFTDSASPVASSSLGASSINNITLQPDDLSATKFGQANASGTWTLKVTGGGASAQILGGWVLTINAAPVVLVTTAEAPAGDIIASQDTTTTINFTVASVDGTLSSSTPTLTGLNSTLATVTASSYTYPNGSFTVKGQPNQWGTNAVKISISDQNGLTGYASFNLGFEFFNHAPTMDFIPKQVTTAGVPTQPLTFKVYDTDIDPAKGTPEGTVPNQNLTVTATSGDNTGLFLPNQNIFLQQSPSDPSGRTWVMTLYPLAATPLGRFLPYQYKDFKRQIPKIPVKPLSSRVPSRINAEKSVGKVLFYTGCVINYVYPEIGEAAIRVLNKAGYDVLLAKGELCCGKPLKSLGEIDSFKALAEKGVKVLSELDADFVLTACPTCALTLRDEYIKILPESESAKRLSGKVQDVNHFLVHHSDIMDRLAPSSLVVTYHDPCHLNFGMNVRSEPRELMKKAAGGYAEMEESSRCCGFGGSFSFLDYRLSGKIANRKVSNVLKTGAQAVAAACPGCMMHLKDALAQAGSSVVALHTLQIIDKALKK